eukprot:COSAG01_NODE_25_length_37050_cov_211.559119_17_plen_58_part_00
MKACRIHTYLPRLLLAHEACADFHGRPIFIEAEPLDVAMGRDAHALGRGLHLLDLHL